MKEFADYITGDLKQLLLDIHDFTPVYVVGGAVRDYFRLGTLDVHDVDLAHNAEIPELIEYLKAKGYHVVETGIEFGRIQVNLPSGLNVDVTKFRAETYEANSRKPSEVFSVKTIEEDLARRDYTWNAMAYKLDIVTPSPEPNTLIFLLIDPYGGLNDLNAKILRAVGNPEDRFSEDPLRILRGIRQAADFGATIEGNTFRAMQLNVA